MTEQRNDPARASMHPFGCEAETSLQDLFEYFERCLQHAEWELASACVPQLVNSAGGLSEKVRDIIKAIICHPYSLKWESIGSPHKLAWFWLQVLKKRTEEQVPPHLRQELEFLLLLEELGSEGIPETALKELQEAFLASQSGHGTILTAAESCLQTLLEKKKPRLAQTLAHFLQEQSSTEGNPLQHTFIQHLMKKLGKPEKTEEWVEEIYSVLALMPWSSGRSSGQLEALCEALWAARDGPLKEERILSCLLRPRCDALVSTYCSTALRLQRDHLLRSSPETQVDLPEAEKLSLSLCCHKDRRSSWKTIFFECLSSGKHFLEQVVVTALDLIKHEEFSQLKDLLQSEFQPLSRLLLLLGWTQCRSLSSAQTLLSILHKEQAAANDSVLQEFANLLSSQLGILEWCKNSNPGISMDALLAQLHTLDSHSALYILHSLTPLAQFEERRILDLLHQLPNLPEKEGTDADDTLSPGVHRNIVLFQGFCAMKYAIYALCVNAHKYSNCTECEIVQHHSPSEEMDQNKTSASSEACHNMFQHYLSECQLYLETVPAMFRLELLENIFSLLFLSTSDFAQQIQKDSNSSLSAGNDAHSEGLLNTRDNSLEADTKAEVDETEHRRQENHKLHPCLSSSHLGYLDLGHFIKGCRGFLADVTAMEGFLKLLKEGLEGMSVLGQLEGQEGGRALHREAEVAASLGCSVTTETFGACLQRLSKHTAEAQWRLQIVTSNQGTGDGSESPIQLSAFSSTATRLRRSKSSSLRKRRKPGRHAAERQTSIEKQNGEVSTSTSDGGGGPAAGGVELDRCPCGGPHSWLVPAMLSPPESLLMSCIRRGNFMEAHQVSVVFNLEAASCSGELAFMEHYKEVLVELGQVEQKMESQSMSSSSSSSEGLGSAAVTGTGRARLGSSGRSTLQAIGSAAAAGVAFYSISDIADRLFSTPAHPLPSLEEGYWLSRCSSDSSGLLYTLLEELSPAAMAAFDLACCHCQLWKTSRQLLDTAERRLNSSLEARGIRVDPKVPHSEGICGFPMVLQQISKILNHSATHKGCVKAEAVGEDQVFANPFGCCIQEVLLCCHPTLSEESIAARLSLTQRLENTLHILSTATDGTEDIVGSSILAQLVEQASLKQSELDAHPVRSSMKQLLRSLDQLCPFEPDGGLARPDYVRSFFDYVNTLASVLVRSLSSEDHSSEVKLGNPLLVLLQTPFQLISHLLFDRQVFPDRVLSLLQQEGLRLSVQQVIVQRCCETLPVWTSCPGDEKDSGQARKDDGPFSVAALSLLLQQHAQDYMATLGITEPVSDMSSESEASVEDHSAMPTNLSTSPPSQSSSFSSTSSSSSSNSFVLTASALTFLKSRSPLLATLACLSACKGETARTQPSGWSGYFRSGRKDGVLDGEQISREANTLLKEFPILRAYLHTMAEPLLGSTLSEGEESPAGLGAVICGNKPLVSLLLSGPQDEAAQAVAAEAFQKALVSRDLCRALSLLELYGQGCDKERVLRDRLLACAALEDGDEGISQLFRIQDANLRARVALQALERWPMSACQELLEFCLNDPNTETSLKTDLELKRKELSIYRQMIDLQPPLPWATWQELGTESKRNPESVFSMILEAKEFALCEQWVELYPVSEQLRLQLQTEHLLSLLEKGQTDEAFQLLEGISDFIVALDVCEHALDRRPGLAACHFLADYLTLHFQRQVSPARRQHIHTLHLGSKVLLTLPQAARQDYFHLLSDPLLMLEQLLMNLKVDWAEVAVRTLRSLLVGQEAGFSAEDIDKLLADYAGKALDFSCAPRERSRSDSVINLQEVLMQCSAQDSGSQSSIRLESPASSSSSTPTHTPSVSSADRERDRGSSGRKRHSFQPPDQPPARKDWVPDTQHDVCMVCRRERFTMFNRRHHCRRCGRLVCQACSEQKMPVDGCPEEEPVRTCDQCYAYFHLDSDNELELAEAPGSPMVRVENLDGMLHLPEVVHRQFQLSSNPAENQLLRSEFYYEQAPSAYLCVGILSLHNDQTACGHQLISHCRSLSRKLTNPEVDACLLTDIMRQLLFSAKMMFVKVGRSQDLALCDSYISKVDVLKILVAANYKYIPSLDDILETSAVARLRNQLLEAEHYQLAVEVSTKSGLEPGGVWQAWAMASLKAGNLSGAREKFGRCLRVPVDRNQLSLGAPLLQEIVQHLEMTVRPTLATSYGEDILASLRELEDILNEVSPVERQEGLTQSNNLHQECLYYLNTYGTHLALISFYMRHDCVTEAMTYLLNKDCPEEVFLEGVLQPSLERGNLGMLQGIMEKLDPSLDACSRHLIASCQFLQRRGHYHCLYHLQQFMMDHVRAAMTCIRFYTHGATSYLQLGEQQRWLVRAKEHLRTYLQEQQGRGAVRRKSQVNSFRKTMSSSDVSRHMNTIELQLEVTRFLHRCDTATSSKSPQNSMSSSKSSGSSSLPTLFGGSPMRIEVACKVMLGGKNIEEGFGIAYRVIQDFQLDAQAVYVRAGQRLVRQRQYGAVRQLLKCVGESGTATKNDCDALILSCVSIADKGPADAKNLESLILEIKSTESKIKAYLVCSKLRPAYLLAVKLEPTRAGPLVQDVLQVAEGAQDSVMQNICRQWLSEHNKSPQQRQGRPSAR